MHQDSPYVVCSCVVHAQSDDNLVRLWALSEDAQDMRVDAIEGFASLERSACIDHDCGHRRRVDAIEGTRQWTRAAGRGTGSLREPALLY